MNHVKESLPRVSVNIPCFNRHDRLKETLRAFSEQQYPDLEIVVADDGSEPALLSTVAKFENAICVRQPHRGIAAAFNLALENSTGDWVIPYGSDDLVEDEFAIEKLVRCALESNVDVVYSHYYEMDDKFKGVKHPYIVPEFTTVARMYSLMLKDDVIPHGGSLWRRAVMPKYDETLESAVDWELYLAALEKGLTMKLFPEHLWIYRVGTDDREWQTKRQLEGCREVLRRRGVDYDTR